jgi:putative colanic acid biosynthesis acetyltransferase WcaF
MTLDVDAARAARPYSRREYLGRALWALAAPLFRFSPRPLFGWRRFLLRLFGARVGAAVHVYPSARVVIPWNLRADDGAAVGEDVLIYNLGPVHLGARSTVSHRAHLCAGTHDYRDPALPLRRLPIVIGADAWVCAQAFVGPGVTVGDGAVVGAGAVAMRSVEPWTVVAGNPARPVKKRELRA